MQITRHTDYALRLLMYVAVRSGRSTIGEAAAALRVSRHHLVKVAGRLGELGHLELVRGYNGGVSLARDPAELTVGRVFRELENCALAECFSPQSSVCVFSPSCVLQGALRSAFEAFCRELDGVTLADLVSRPQALRSELGLDRDGGRS